MKKVFLVCLLVCSLLISGCSKKTSDDLILIEGGAFVNTTSNYYQQSVEVEDFYIGKYEVTQKQWLDVLGYNPSAFVNLNAPVEMVTWYESIQYCNARSEKEGLSPYYNIDSDTIDSENISQYDNTKWTVTINEEADGYRLPTAIEWEYAASGGQKSKNYIYSGSNDIEEVAWYWRNAGDTYIKSSWNWTTISNNKNTTKTCGEKLPNELGLYDMSGNVREWCFDWYKDSDIPIGYYRVCKGGGWIGEVNSCEINYNGKFEASGLGADQGLRVCRNK